MKVQASVINITRRVREDQDGSLVDRYEVTFSVAENESVPPGCSFKLTLEVSEGGDFDLKVGDEVAVTQAEGRTTISNPR